MLIQYGAAPFTSDTIIVDIIRVMTKKGSVVTATPCYQLMGSNDEEETRTWTDRNRYIQIACPCVFRYSYPLDFYRRTEIQGLIGRAEPHAISLMYAFDDPLYQAYGRSNKHQDYHNGGS